jgi:hypothetical protein
LTSLAGEKQRNPASAAPELNERRIQQDFSLPYESCVPLIKSIPVAQEEVRVALSRAI